MRRRSRSPGKLLGIKTVIVMPPDAPQVKLEATRGYGAEVVQYVKHEDREDAGRASSPPSASLTLIPPFDHPHIIAGQGTAAKELIEDAGAARRAAGAVRRRRPALGLRDRGASTSRRNAA